MATERDGNYALGRLILDYIKAFMWPMVALVVVVIYQDDVRQILTEREVDIFGLRIGEQVAQIESQTMAEIEDLRVLLETRQDSAGDDTQDAQLNEDIGTKLNSLERNLSREINLVQDSRQAVQTAQPGQRPAAREEATDREDRAAAAERRGFEALIERNLPAAITAFEEAREIWPEYHNVAEIARLLNERTDSLGTPESNAWPQLYRQILTRYSWGMPQDQRQAMRAAVAQAY